MFDRRLGAAVSSVARVGGYSYPIGLKSMHITLFLALLRPIFTLKTKTAPPPLVSAIIGQ